ncbi:Holliday junction resolvase RecU [Enterococcus alcedinis]|uniref:Holliday junction resolvase RecU n=1 Tax=Enterococcus alcedinis TaxID=1274384 RepID=A0A917JDM1_9ENTE|nr:Holliday junction resolvase RecU [Enterococcus alcedinis]MBP2100983.1 recombination protein U [Enterococcus alcedinis]GGI64719.1 hypothetical protein GCM10011482_03730 [Enterococcus alcedinis]
MGYQRRDINRKSNYDGKFLERLIEQGCIYYEHKCLALIEKTPEPFIVTKLGQRGTFSGRFTGRAQPDFKGTLKGGRSIAFEAKFTSKDRIKQDVVTLYQSERLTYHEAMGAVVGVVCMIGRTVAFVPWSTWKEMQSIYGRRYMTEKELKEFQVPTPGYVDFLSDYHNKEKLR